MHRSVSSFLVFSSLPCPELTSKLTHTRSSFYPCFQSPPPAVALIDAMTGGWAPWTRPCCSSACSAAMHSHAANQPELNLATHWGSVTMNMAFTASKLSVRCLEGCWKAKVGCRLSRFAVKQMYITYWARHLSLIQTTSGWLVRCRRPAVINFWWNVLWHLCIWLFVINHRIMFWDYDKCNHI